jgi:hypothetical protein
VTGVQTCALPISNKLFCIEKTKVASTAVQNVQSSIASNGVILS